MPPFTWDRPVSHLKSNGTPFSSKFSDLYPHSFQLQNMVTPPPANLVLSVSLLDAEDTHQYGNDTWTVWATLLRKRFAFTDIQDWNTCILSPLSNIFPPWLVTRVFEFLPNLFQISSANWVPPMKKKLHYSTEIKQIRQNMVYSQFTMWIRVLDSIPCLAMNLIKALGQVTFLPHASSCNTMWMNSCQIL